MANYTTMRSLSALFGAALLLTGANAKPNPPPDTDVLGPDKHGKYWIYGDGIAASFIPYGASISNLIIKDKKGVARDIVMGFDEAKDYATDKSHPHLGGVPGRYANRIKNSTFTLDGVAYNILPNENPTAAHPDGVDTLHGGPDGWDWRDFTVVAHTNNTITFSIIDPDGKEGFPGEVISYITYTLGDMTWDAKMIAIATTKKTPIMLSSHTYWNLDGFANTETNTIFDHTFHLPFSGQRVGVDNILIPTGEILANAPGSVNDFRTAPKKIGAGFKDPELQGNCGFNCTGYGTSPLPSPSNAQPANPRPPRQLLARQPPQPARLARRRRLRRQPVLCLVRHPPRHLLGPGRVPDVLVQRAERVVPAQGVAGRRPGRVERGGQGREGWW